MAEILGIFGLQGWGKTALLTYFAYLQYLQGVDVYSNYPLGFNHIYFDTLKEAQNIRNGFIVFDEFWEWVHARRSQSNENFLMMEICLLNRKRGNSLGYNSQLPRTIDVILKDVTNFKYIPRMVTHADGKRYVHYIMKNILGFEYPEMIVPIHIKELGKLFDTRYEVKKLGTEENKSFLERGLETENKCIMAINKVKGFKGALFPNSGRNSGFKGDIFIKTPSGNYLGDIKGSYKGYVVICDPKHKCNVEITKFIENARSWNLKPVLLFPKVNKLGKSLNYPVNWFVYPINNNSYLLENKSHIVNYNKLVKNSIILNKWDL